MKVLQPTAWFMIHRIREARDTDNRSFLRGPVEVDETYIGGKEGPQAHRKVPIDELCDPERTLHIDSKVLAVAEASEEPVAEIGGGENGDDANNGHPHMTRKQQAELLRRQVDTVGRPGQEGERIRNVISVGMLSEGWDAKTVTHIMSLRAFTSQLLCVPSGYGFARSGSFQAA